MKKDDYEEVNEPVQEEQGEFFLARYRALAPDVKIIAPKSVQQALRLNTSKTTAEDLMRSMSHRGAFVKKIPFLQLGYYVHGPFSAGSTPEYLLGHYYLQAPLSQLTCEVLAPTPGATVLDMAAAPGGKATYLAQLVGAQGKIIALDNDMNRLASVRNNVERLGLTNVLCIKKDARFADDLKETFHFVLLDAPCSGNFCSEEGWLQKRTVTDIMQNSRVQRELIKAAYLCLAPGGRLLYSTCSLEPEEDEVLVDWALKKFSDLNVVSLATLPLGDSGATNWEKKELDPRLAGTRRFWPHKTGMEGFYMALLEKRQEE